jgi:hypothetical protein
MATRDDPGLDPLLRRAQQLVGAASVHALALSDLGALDLPPLASAEVDQAQLRAMASLYLVAELESAGVIPSAEGLARLAMSGSITANLGDAAGLIRSFWRARNVHPTVEERTSFFAGLFGVAGGPADSSRGRNGPFEDLLIDLCEALYKLDEQASNARWGGLAQQSRVQRAAQRLLENLVTVSSGITVFMAQEILGLMREALAILGHPAVKAALRARSVWETIDAVDRQLHQPLREHDLFVQRGQAGMTLLAWLADAAPMLSVTGKPLVGLDHPVIAAAADWLEASLRLGEAVQPPAPADHSSGWAALGG